MALRLDRLDGTDDFRVDGAGFSVSAAGDVNGDGIDDVITAKGGAAYVVFGRATGFGPDLPLDTLDGSDGFRIESTYNDYIGSVGGAGDVNGDGFDDLIVRVPSTGTDNDYGTGAAYVIFGTDAGFP